MSTDTDYYAIDPATGDTFKLAFPASFLDALRGQRRAANTIEGEYQIVWPVAENEISIFDLMEDGR